MMSVTCILSKNLPLTTQLMRYRPMAICYAQLAYRIDSPLLILCAIHINSNHVRCGSVPCDVPWPC